MDRKEIDAIKSCAAIVAKKYDPLEPWIDPNCLLSRFNMTEWELLEDCWHDPETGANYPISALK